ncbi:MAG TPA: hypothetical protein DCW83_04395 [Saprospirales bacterium]|nr:hypothetical protein [Saprospirales bacterium]
MKKSTMALVGVLFSGGAIADGSIRIANDFLVRGSSQTDGSAAVQGSISKSFDNGMYVGVWGSNISFDGGLELDTFAGWRGGDNVAWDVGVVHASYPNQSKHENGGLTSSFTEYYVTAAWNKLAVGYYHSPDYFSVGGREAGKNDYFYAEANLLSLDDHSVDLHYGITKSRVFDYNDWSVTYTKSFDTIDFFIEQHGTSGMLHEDTTIVGISKTF